MASTIKTQLPDVIAAVKEELGAGPRKRSVLLFDGKRLSSKPESTIYRFEIPEGVFLGHVDDPGFIFKDSKLEGEILSIDNQFVTISVEENLGERVPQIAVEWASKLILQRLHDRLIKINNDADKIDFSLTNSLFYPEDTCSDTPDARKVRADEQRNDPQRQAIAGAMVNKVSFVWGPPGTGKTSTLGFIAYNLIKNGERILFATNTNRAVDVAMQNVAAAFKYFEEPFEGIITRYGKPFLRSDEDLASICFQNEIEKVQSQIKAEIQEEYRLLHEYRALKREVSEYTSYFHDTEQTESAIKDVASKYARAQKELTNLKARLAGRKGSGFLSRLVGEFLGTPIETIQQQVERKSSEVVSLENTKNDLLKKLDQLKKECPVSEEVLEQYSDLAKRIKKKGGEDTLASYIKEKLKVDEEPLLAKKKMIGATLAKVITNEVFFKLDYDALIIDEASMVSLPYLLTLSTLAKARIIIVGDPQQLPPIAQSDSDWFQKDIYLHASGCESVQDLFKWHEANSRYTYFLNTQYRMVGALGDIISQKFYQGKLLNGTTDKGDEDAGIVFVNTSPLRPFIEKMPGSDKKFAPCNPIHTERIIAILKK